MIHTELMMSVRWAPAWLPGNRFLPGWCVCVWFLVSAIHHGWLGGRGNAAATFYCWMVFGFCDTLALGNWSAQSQGCASQGRLQSADWQFSWWSHFFHNKDEVTVKYLNLTQFPLKDCTLGINHSVQGFLCRKVSDNWLLFEQSWIETEFGLARFQKNSRR
jgi:hypothetical protein